MGLDLLIKKFIVKGELKELGQLKEKRITTKKPGDEDDVLLTEPLPKELVLPGLPTTRTDEKIGDTFVTSPLPVAVTVDVCSVIYEPPSGDDDDGVKPAARPNASPLPVAVTYDVCNRIHQTSTGDYADPTAYLSKMLQVVRRDVHPPNVQVVVLIIDHPDATPPEKWEEWDTRDANAAKKCAETGAPGPYPPGCTISLDGVFDKDGNQLPFEASRLVGNRYLRNELFATENIDAALKAMGPVKAAGLIPFVVDRCCQNIAFFDNIDEKLHNPETTAVVIECATRIYKRWYGEADIGQVFWAVELMKRGFFACVTSTDTDFIATSCSLLLPETREALDLHEGQFDDLLGWRCDPSKQAWAGKEGDVILILKAIRLRVAEIGITPAQLMTACVMKGNDFVKEADLSKGISFGSFLLFLKAEAAKHKKAGTTLTSDVAGWPVQALTSIHNCACLVISMYAHASNAIVGAHTAPLLSYGLSLQGVQDRLERKNKGKALTLPLGAKFGLVKQRMRMAALYWRVLDPACRAEYLEQFEEAIAEATKKKEQSATTAAVIARNNKLKHKGAPKHMQAAPAVSSNGLRGATHDADAYDDAAAA